MKKLTIEYIKNQFVKEGYQLLTKKYKNHHQKLDYICSKNHKHSISWSNWQQGIRCFHCVNRSSINIKFVKLEFKKKGYKLLTSKYENAKQKLKYICPIGHNHNMSWNNWQRGNGCPYCSKKIKPTMAIIKPGFEKRGYKLLSTDYINAHTKLEYECPNGHKYSTRWGHFAKGHGCPRCAGVEKLSLEFVRSEFEKSGYQLLTTKYINSDQKLTYLCPNKHKHSSTWNNWRYGCRCPYCSNKIKKTVASIKLEFEMEGYTLLTKTYRDNQQKLKCICPKGHSHSTSWGNWTNGHRCSFCHGHKKLSINFVKSEFKKEGYILTTEKYNNAHRKLYYLCPKGHENSVTWSNWKKGNRCSSCVTVISKGEVEVRNFIKSLGVTVLANDKNQISSPKTDHRLELDIFMPDLNKAIEYNGEYWHRKKGKDLLKQRLCKLKGIDLMFVWDNDWKKFPDICKNNIEAFIFDDLKLAIGA